MAVFGEGLPLSIYSMYTTRLVPWHHLPFSYFQSSDRPTLRLLRNFPAGKKRPGKTFDILEAIGASYRTFGIFLLRDNDGAKMNALEDTGKRSPYKIAEGIITEWRQGHGKTPVTYKTLVSCLRDAKLKVLASDIEKASGVNMGRLK